MTRRLLVILGLVLSLGRTAPGDSTQLNYVERTLPNGLRVVTLEDFSCPVVAVQVWFHVGSKNEDPKRQGFAHMFEHMMFRGTERLGPKAHFELLRQIGGDCNAYTSFDNTTYVNKLPSNQLELALFLEAERMAFLKIDDDSFFTERAVVEEERRLGLNRPYGGVLEKVLPVFFKKHPYQWSTIGRIPHLRAATIDELARFWETYYVPNNAALVIVGAVKNEEAQQLAERYFGWIPRGNPPPKVTELEPPQTEAREATIAEPKGPVTIVGLGYRTVPQSHPDYQALEALGNVLGGGESSRIYQDLVQKQEIAIAAGSANLGLEQDGLFIAFAAVKPFGAGKEKVLESLHARIDDMRSNPATADELEKAKTEMRKGAVQAGTTVDAKARLLGTYAVLFDDLSRVNKRFDEINALNIADLDRVASEYLIAQRQTTVVIEPSMGELLKSFLKGKNEDEGAAPATKPAENRVAQRSGPKAHAVRPTAFPTTAPLQPLLDEFPKVPREEKTLSNGLKVVVVPNDEVPLVTMTLGIKFGAWTDDSSHIGAASMSASLITQGTEHFDSAELAHELEAHAISLTGAVGMDVGAVNASCMSAESDRAMKLLAEVVRRATFPERDFKRIKDQALSALMVSAQTPSYLAEREFRSRVYAGHPYARTSQGEPADMKKLTPDDLRKWWRTYVRPDTCVLYVAGDIKPDDGFNLAEKYFADWTADGPAPSPSIAPVPAPSQTHIYLVDKPGSVQSEIRVGHLGMTRDQSDYSSARVLSQIFGGSYNSRLNETLRVKKGLTYAAFGGFSAQKYAGLFEVSTFSKTPSTADAVAAILEEIDSLRKNPLGDKELSDARSFLVGSFASSRETPQDTIGDLWLIEYCKLPSDYLQSSLSKVAKTQADDVNRIAGSNVNPDQLVIVVVGDAKRIQEDLAKIAPLTVVKPE
ncbi:MAG: M16 family metallopeptidase [Tepidisphaeraceae bacterium]